MGWATKIKGSVLQFSILVAVMVTLLLLSFIALNQTFSFFQYKSESFLDALKQNEDIFFSISNENIASESNSTESNFRGGFQLLKATSTLKSSEIKKFGLVGLSLKDEKTTLYLQDNQKPLVMVGRAAISGKSYLPSSGVKAGVISGTYFSGDQLINGQSLPSDSWLPDLESNYELYLRETQGEPNLINQEMVSIKSILKNSFYSPEKIVFSESPITIYEQAYGNIQFQSTEKITISKHADLMDVLIVSPKVKIEKGFKGRIHVIASDSIIIEENVELHYPSSLVLRSKKNIETSNAITIEGNSKVAGNVIYLDSSQKEKPAPNVIISENARVLGSVYCQGYLDVRGAVKGSVYTEYFITDASGSRYINHILDGRIISDRDSDLLCTLPLNEKKKGVVQWMY